MGDWENRGAGRENNNKWEPLREWDLGEKCKMVIFVSYQVLKYFQKQEKEKETPFARITQLDGYVF